MLQIIVAVVVVVAAEVMEVKEDLVDEVTTMVALRGTILQTIRRQTVTISS